MSLVSISDLVNLNKRIDIGLDLGTANILIYLPERGIVLNEPAMVARDRASREVIAVGKDALAIHEKIHPGIVTIRPIANGVIADYEATTVLIRELIRKALSRSVQNIYRMVISVPLGITPVETRAVYDAAVKVGAKEVHFVQEPMAAAIGTGMDPFEAAGNMVVDIGGGTTDIAVITLGGIASGESLRIAGNDINTRIIQFFRNRYNLAISDYAAENIKLQMASAEEPQEDLTMNVQGMNVGTGLPETVTIHSGFINDALKHSVSLIVMSIKKHIEALIVKPEIALDILGRGIFLTGGGSQLKGLDHRIKQETNMPVKVSQDPMTDTIKGVGEIIEDLKHYKPILGVDFKVLSKEDT
ncbi:rod shape-determining protein [Prosthecochloris sp. ZM_2]|uniref:rod shape-determining protein n=1 Tax=Prosthecochloris sp. ZM_2 TaxID=2045206 RepID=UPI000DF723D0|nr:rod shape-determining protein [Prosthecochloris sp. ZM_2]RNA65316.1 rod shape-determining protein [Prosthecochloris sp. ZM_2]